MFHTSTNIDIDAVARAASVAFRTSVVQQRMQALHCVLSKLFGARFEYPRLCIIHEPRHNCRPRCYILSASFHKCNLLRQQICLQTCSLGGDGQAGKVVILQNSSAAQSLVYTSTVLQKRNCSGVAFCLVVSNKMCEAAPAGNRVVVVAVYNVARTYVGGCCIY